MGRTGRKGPEAATAHAQTSGVILEALFTQDIELTDEQADTVFSTFCTAHTLYLNVIPRGPFEYRVGEAMQLHRPSARVRRLATIARERLYEDSHGMFGGWGSLLYGVMTKIDPPLGGDWWSAVVLASVEDSEPWLDLLRHAARSGKKSTVSARWTKKSIQLMGAIDEGNVEARIVSWLSGLRFGAHSDTCSKDIEEHVAQPHIGKKGRKWLAVQQASGVDVSFPLPLDHDDPTENGWRAIPRANHSSTDTAVVIGLIRLVRSPDSLKVLKKVLGRSLKKAPLIGVVAQSVARIAANAIGALGTPEARKVLEKRRDSASGRIRKIFEEALQA